MKFKIFPFLLLAGITVTFSSCSDAPETAPAPIVEVKKPSPFPFYKNIEIKPGLNFEIISWGRGLDSIGGIAVLLSDSAHKNFEAVTAARNGVVTDAWNLDLDTDGNPELYIQTVNHINQSDLLVYEYGDGTFNKINFPSLSDRTKKIFLGNDKFYVKEGHLIRSIPVKAVDGGKSPDMLVDYQLGGNSFNIKEVKE